MGRLVLNPLSFGVYHVTVCSALRIFLFLAGKHSFNFFFSNNHLALAANKITRQWLSLMLDKSCGIFECLLETCRWPVCYESLLLYKRFVAEFSQKDPSPQLFGDDYVTR